MKAILTNNTISTKYLIMPIMGIINPVAVLRDVRLVYMTDSEGKKTDTVIAVKYDCVDPETYSTFSIKVETNKPVITAEELEKSEDIITIEIPDTATIRPYEISYGSARVIIEAPFVKLHKN